MSNEELEKIMEALRIKALGNTIEQCVETWKRNDKGKQELTEKTLKKIKNDIDTQACIKLIDIELKKRELEKDLSIYDNMSDEELEKEKQRLLKELFEQEKKDLKKISPRP